VVARWDTLGLLAAPGQPGSHQCFDPVLETISSTFNSCELDKFDERKSGTQQIRDVVEPRFAADEWSTKVLVTQDFPGGVLQANYEVDFQLQFFAEGCSLRHQVSLELAFDNRQAIGANLLKMDLANTYFVESTGGLSISVIVVATASGRDLGHWDGAVGIDLDYSWALRNAYSRYFKTPIVLLTVS
jgi:hypothetical protein